MRSRLAVSLRTLLEQHVPERAKGAARDVLADHLADRVVTYRELSTRPDVRRWQFGDSASFEFTDPVYSNELPEVIARLVGRHECPQPYVLEIPDVEVRHRQGFKITRNGDYVVYNFGQGTAVDGAPPDPALELAYDVVDAIGDRTWPLSGRDDSGDVPELDLAVPMLHRWARNYSHWTEEWLTQLHGVEQYASITGEHPTLLIPPDPPDFIPQSLDLLGYGPAEYVELDHERVRVNSLVLPSIRRCWSSTSDDYIRDISALEWLRDRVLSRVSLPDDRDTPSKLLVSRQQDAETRRIVNWDAVETALSERGYETVVLTDLDYSEQKRLFAGVDVVVGPHGAGLTEFIYATDAGLLELFGDDYTVPVYFEMATGLDHEYGCLVCESEGGDLVVDVDELHEAVDTLEDAVEGVDAAGSAEAGE